MIHPETKKAFLIALAGAVVLVGIVLFIAWVLINLLQS